MMKSQTIQQEQTTAAPVQAVSEQSEGGTATFEDNRAGAFQLKQLRNSLETPPVNENTAQLQKEMQSGNRKGVFPFPQTSRMNGLPAQLKSGVENLSGFSMDDVKVHYNSSKPAQLKAHAYAQGTDIHLGPGQEKHLPHEAWHVVQQKQGRVRPTMQMKGKTPINDDAGLEKEADVMGAKARSLGLSSLGSTSDQAMASTGATHQPLQKKAILPGQAVAQRAIRKSADAKVGIEIETTLPVRKNKEVLPGTWFLCLPESQKSADKKAQKADNARRKEMIDLENQFRELEDIPANKERREELAAMAKEKYDLIRGDFDPGYKTPVHIGEGWKAVVDHVPKLRDLFREEILPIDSAVEIVTDPVATVDEAKDIMKDVFEWIESVMEGIGNNGFYQEGEHIFEIPKEAQKEIFSEVEGQLLGNIQINVGSTLEDVTEVFKGNLNTILDPTDKRVQKKILDDHTSDEFWGRVMTALGAKESAAKVDLQDEIYLRNIMFQYLNISLSAILKEQNQTEKNLYPILGKTKIKTQVVRSNWAKREMWTIDGAFRKDFHDAIMEAYDVNSKNFDTDPEKDTKKKANFVSYMGKIKTNEEPKKITDLAHLNKREQLKIRDAGPGQRARYAGVFELRGVQDRDIPMNEWATIWYNMLDPEYPSPFAPKEVKLDVLEADEVEGQMGNVFAALIKHKDKKNL